MPSGTIKNIIHERGYGFIPPEGGGSDIFFHKTVVTPRRALADAGLRVEYEG